MAREQKSQYSVRPQISLTAKIINFILWPLQKLQLLPFFRPLSLNSIKVAACRRTNLDDFGSELGHEKIFVKVFDLMNNYKQTPLGQILSYEFFVHCFETKLRVEHELSDPTMMQCLQEPIQRPIFVAGMPRTGTTYLHRLLALDPAARAPLAFELFEPVQRKKGDLARDQQNRKSIFQRQMDIVHMIVPRFAAVHEAHAMLPEECLCAMSQDAPLFFPTFPQIIKPASEIFDWDTGQAYKNYAKILRLLQYQESKEAFEQDNGSSSKKRWVLKCPLHTCFLPYLYDAFPDATVVFTHRKAEEAVPSFASLIETSQSIFHGSRYMQMDEIGLHCLKFISKTVRCLDMADREKSSAHVKYETLIADPVGTVKKLYETLDLEFTSEYESTLQNFVTKDREKRQKLARRTGGLLHYHPREKFGLSAELIKSEFSWYDQKYVY